MAQMAVIYEIPKDVVLFKRHYIVEPQKASFEIQKFLKVIFDDILPTFCCAQKVGKKSVSCANAKPTATLRCAWHRKIYATGFSRFWGGTPFRLIFLFAPAQLWSLNVLCSARFY